MTHLRRHALGIGLAAATLAPLAMAQPAASAAATTSAHCSRVITTANSQATIHLVLHTCATFRPTGLDWSGPSSSNPRVVEVLKQPTRGTTPQWSLKAVGRGTATITSTGRPICAPGEACPDFIVRGTLRIEVVA
jgi:hypothetical protein